MFILMCLMSTGIHELERTLPQSATEIKKRYLEKVLNPDPISRLDLRVERYFKNELLAGKRFFYIFGGKIDT